MRLSYLLGHPEVESYLDRVTLDWLYKVMIGTSSLWCCLLLTAPFFSKNKRAAALYAFSVHLTWWALCALMAYVMGPATSPILVLYMAGVVSAFYLFEGPALYVPLLLALAVRVWVSLNVSFAGLRYAPIFRVSPATLQGLSDTYLAGLLLSTSFLFILCAVVLAILRRAEKREAEAAARHYRSAVEFEQAIDAGQDSVLRVDVSGNITAWNPGAEALTGFSAEEVLGKALLSLAPPEELRLHQRYLERVLAGESVAGTSGWMRTKDGRRRDLLVSAVPLRGEEGALHGATLIARDITAQKEAEAAVRRSKEELEEQVRRRTAELEEAHQRLRAAEKMRAMGELASGVAHDFNNILANVGVQLELLRLTQGSSPKTEPIYAAIEESVLRGGRSASQMLGLASPAGDGHASADLHAVIERLLPSLLEGSAGIKWDVNLRTSRKWVALSEPQIESIIANLIDNARQAMPTGGRIGVATADLDNPGPGGSSRTRSGGFVELLVQDTGTGIPAADLPRIFEPYFSTRRAKGGHGLGLFGVYNLVQAAGGSISAESTPGKGTRFRVLLPGAPASRALAAAPIAHAPAPATHQAPWGKPRILIVDDEALFRDALEQFIEALGFDYESAADGAEALKIIESRPINGRPAFDLVLLDRIMPVMGGAQLLEALQPLDQRTRFVIVSGNAGAADIQALKALGAAEILHKPFRIADVRAVFERLLGPITAPVSPDVTRRA